MVRAEEEEAKGENNEYKGIPVCRNSQVIILTVMSLLFEKKKKKKKIKYLLRALHVYTRSQQHDPSKGEFSLSLLGSTEAS